MGRMRVSPGLRSRPSLSGKKATVRATMVHCEGVAGTTVPAFVERTIVARTERPGAQVGVAGTTVPAFVERARGSLTTATSSSGGVAGTTVPAFVERTKIACSRGLGAAGVPWCRRDYGPGLR